MKLVVITGCLGLIGSHVTQACLDKGWMVYGIDNCTYAANLSFIEKFKKNKNFTFVKGDISTISFLPDCDYVINLAAESHVGNSIIDSSQFIKSNVEGVKNLLDLIRKMPANDVEQPVFFHFSTDEVYGDIKSGFHSENDNLNPSNPYSASKAAADMFILAFARTYGTKYIILRPTNNYGIGQYHEKLIPASVRCLLREKKLKLHDEGKPFRNWLHASDTAKAVIKIIESGVENEIYNVAGNFEQRNFETFNKIVDCYFGKKITDWERYVDLEHKRPGQDVRYALDDNKLKSLGWEPEKVFDQEILEIVEYYKNNFRW
jgi:dTDP-glucose 4,6-dehydratase